MGANFEGYQTLQPFDTPTIARPYQLLPKLFANANYFYGYNRFQYQLNSELTYFHHPGLASTNQSLTTGARFHLSPQLSYPWHRSWGYFSPSLALPITLYQLLLPNASKLANKPSRPQRILPIFYVDTGLYFDKFFTFFQNGYIQTLEPRVFYVNIPYRDQNDLPNFDSSLNTFTIHQLFAINRFNGLDRIGDANQLALAFTSRVLKYATGEERLWLQIGQQFYFRNRGVTLCDMDIDPACRLTEDLVDPKGNRQSSPLIAELGMILPENWSLRLETQYDTRHTTLEKYAMGIQYNPDPEHILNLAYYATDDAKVLNKVQGERLSQIDASFVWQVATQWQVLGRWHYNLAKHFPFSMVAGLEYNSCCWALRLGGTRAVQLNTGAERQYHNAFFIQLILKGLTGIGVDPTYEFKHNIPGYERVEY